LRLDHHAQWEVRQYAQAIAAIVADWLPLTWEAFVDYRLGAATLSAQELDALRTVLGAAGIGQLCQTARTLGASQREVDALRATLGGGE